MFHKKTLIGIYHALFNSHLQYGCQLWGLCENTISNPVLILQKRAVRLITFSDFRSHSSPLFFNLKILKVYDQVKVLNILFVHKFLNAKLLSDLLNYFNFVKLDHRHETRGVKLGLLSIPTSNTICFGIKSLTKIAISQCNAMEYLPEI